MAAKKLLHLKSWLQKKFPKSSAISRFQRVSISRLHLRKDEIAELPFSCMWTVPSPVLLLYFAQLEPSNIRFYLVDDDGATVCEDQLTSLPGLRNLGVDTKTLLKANTRTHDGTGYSLSDQQQINLGKLRLLMTAYLDWQCEDNTLLVTDRPVVIESTVRLEEDPISDPLLLITVDIDQHLKIYKALDDI